MTNMFATTNVAFQGNRSMQILLENQGNNSSIAQYDQYGIPDSTLYVTPGAFYSFGGWLKSGGISQPSEHWLTWISTKTGYDTNNRPALPWPYYFTPHLLAGTNPTPWTYLNRTFQLPLGFPNVEIGHTYTINAPGSGSLYLDNIFFRQIPAPASTNWTTWIPFGSSWRYFTNTPSANWSAPGFNDAGWLTGTAKFGAGSGPTNIATRVPQLRPAYYFRKNFVLAAPDTQELLLSATCTDDSGVALYPPRIFLNGTEIVCPLEIVTAQGNETRYFDLLPFAGLLKAGTNTIAVQLNNYWADWDDVAFDLSLKAIPYRPAFPRLTAAGVAGNSTFLSTETSAGTIWQLQSCDGWNAPWQAMLNFTNATGTNQVFQDTGQNSRLLPAKVNARYYRLVPY
jgi:hypothetical protein